MTLDDFNYRQFNRYVLVNPENPGAGETTTSEDEDFDDDKKIAIAAT